MQPAATTLVPVERVRKPFLWAHVAAFGGGAVAMASSARPLTVVPLVFVLVYLAVAGVALTALIRDRAPMASLMLVDAVTMPSVPILTGQEPASVHVALLIVVLTAAVTLPFPRLIGGVALIGSGIGLVIEPNAPLVDLSPAMVDASETMGIVVGLAIGGLAVTIFTALMRESIERQADALVAEQRAGQLQQQFIAMVSHELRTPLTSIHGFADLLANQRQRLSVGEVDEFTEAISLQSAHLTRLVDDVLAVLRIQSGRLSVRSERVRLADAASAAVEMLQIATDGAVVLGSGLDLEVSGDRDRIIQVVRNLVENSLKYGGTVVSVSAANFGDVVRATIEDDGPGIPEHMVEHVFAEFVQLGLPAERVAAGFGLGLPISRRLVAAMGGRLWYAQSRLGGAGFVVELPVAGNTAAAPAAAS